MIEREVVIKNALGLHARPAALIVKISSKFESQIWLEKDGQKADGKSILSVMTLAVPYDTKIKVCANGKDEKEAVDSIVKLIEDKFNEE
jgi:phosphotransferase system HPr (HPr) family protein